MEDNKKGISYKWLALLVIVLGTFMAVLDSSIVNIAVPKMMSVFGVTIDEARWIITAYSLVLGAVIPLTGYLADRFGRKKLYIFSLITFTIGSLFCGIAWSNNIMIVARIIQGLGGGMVMPVSMAIIFQIFPKEGRGTALGFWGIAAMAAPAIGPTLSGYIIQYLDWRLIFTINVPIGVLTVILAWILLQESETRQRNTFDFIGLISSSIGMVFCLYVLGEGSKVDWGDLKNQLMMTIGIFCFIIFIINELLHPEPLLNLRTLKIPAFTLSILISSVLNMAMYGVVFIIPLFLQNLRGLTPMQTGMLMFPSAIATGLTMPIGGKLFDKLGAKPVVIPGLIIMTITTFELSRLSLDTSNYAIQMLLVIRGIGLGLAMMPSTSAGMNAVPQALISEASALSNTIRQVAGAISITILTSVLQGQLDTSYARMAEAVNPFNYSSTTLVQMIQGGLMQSGLSLSDASGLSLTYLSGLLQRQAYMDGINTTLLLATLISIVTVPLALFIKGKKTREN